MYTLYSNIVMTIVMITVMYKIYQLDVHTIHAIYLSISILLVRICPPMGKYIVKRNIGLQAPS